LTFEDKVRIFNSFNELREVQIKNGKTNFHFDSSRVQKKVIACELGPNRAGYIFVGFLKDFDASKDDRGFINIDKHISGEKELRKLIARVIESLRFYNRTAPPESVPKDVNIHKQEEAVPMLDEYIDFLQRISFYPIESTWNTFTIEHKLPLDQDEKGEVEAYIKSQSGRKNGLYIYKCKDDACLYIGKGKPISGRLVSHYRESFQEVPGDTKDKKWHRFFSKQQGNLHVYWKELEGEENRKIVESMLDYVLKPAFREWE
jgi:hypothetical protein